MSEVIKYEGDNSTFIWKHPSEDFNSFTQLIVHESQEAILFMDGKIREIYLPGSYILNLPDVPRVNILSWKGKQSLYHSEIYFVNKTEQMSIGWGTDSHIHYIDPVYGFPLSVGASGSMSLQVMNGKKLLLKLLGTGCSLNRLHLSYYFKSILMTKVKAYLGTVIKNKAINIFEIDEHLEELSGELQELLMDDFAEYGILLVHFFLSTIAKPEEEILYTMQKEKIQKVDGMESEQENQEFCVNCGYQFQNSFEKFCANCGSKREKR